MVNSKVAGGGGSGELTARATCSSNGVLGGGLFAGTFQGGLFATRAYSEQVS